MGGLGKLLRLRIESCKKKKKNQEKRKCFFFSLAFSPDEGGFLVVYIFPGWFQKASLLLFRSHAAYLKPLHM